MEDTEGGGILDLGFVRAAAGFADANDVRAVDAGLIAAGGSGYFIGEAIVEAVDNEVLAAATAVSAVVGGSGEFILGGLFLCAATA
mmetsp:Transcript_23222/g.50302  ORF Transcript_23222/g.50302 Transcript_23222/m.50302 type:complete len:86 (-) Transcript_23222:48-305(-)